MEKTDQELVLNYISGDEGSLKILIERYIRPIYNFVYHLSRNVNDAEDITQETFVKVWKNLKKYNPKQSFKTWIFSIAKNTSIDWLRKKRNLVFSDFDTEDGNNYIENTTRDENALQDELAIIAEDKKFLSEALKKLSLIYQSILVLRYSEELTFKEIGDILGKSLDTVKSQHRRALIQLKKTLENRNAPN